MSGIDPLSGGRPRLGIFVDCKPARKKIQTRQVHPQLPVEGTARRASSWQLSVTLLALGLVFLLAVTAGALSVLPVSERDRVTVQVPRQQNPEAVAKPKLKAGVKAPAKIASVKSAGIAEETSIVRDNRISAEKIDPPVTEIIAAVEPPKSPIMEVSVKDDSSCPSGVCSGSGDFCGTAVHFLASPKLAEEEAAKQHKLVFVLHVSGNFEDPGFT
jgi:hypothetical protein